MTAELRGWTGPARAMALAIDRAVTAACAADGDAFGEAVTDLRRVDREQLGVLLGAVTTDLLEQLHPDGMDAEAAEDVLRSAERRAGDWFGPVDEPTLVRVLTSALGITDPDDAPALDPARVLTHGLLLVADLLTASSGQLAPVLDAALRELMRAQTVELP